MPGSNTRTLGPRSGRTDTGGAASAGEAPATPQTSQARTARTAVTATGRWRGRRANARTVISSLLRRRRRSGRGRELSRDDELDGEHDVREGELVSRRDRSIGP